jgi:hypothetical protein
MSHSKRENRLSKRGEHKYGADGHVGLSQRMVRIVAIYIIAVEIGLISVL